MKPASLVAVGLLVLILGLLVHAPAAVLYGWTLGARTESPLRLYGVDGGLFSGSAAQIRVSNRVLANDLRWTLRPAALARGRVVFHVRSGGAPLLFDGIVTSDLGGMRVTELKASADLRTLATLAGQTLVPVSGQVGLDLGHLQMKDQWPYAAEGRLQLLGLSWALGQPAMLGDFEAQLQGENGTVQATVTTLSGVIDVMGEAQLNPDRSYVIDLRLRPSADAPPMLRNMLQSLGPADAEGYHRLRHAARATTPASAQDTTPSRAPPPGLSSPTPPRSVEDDEAGVTFGG